MAGLAAAASIVGTVVSAVGTIAAGQANRQAADYQAAQYDIRAKEERAAAQNDALEYRHRAKLVSSTLQARSAASGFGAADPTVLDLAGDIAATGILQAALTRYGGESRAVGTEAQAEGMRMSGRAAETGAYYSAAATVIGGAGSLFQRYGQSFTPTVATAPRYG